jgi:hypothetical protein
LSTFQFSRRPLTHHSDPEWHQFCDTVLSRIGRDLGMMQNICSFIEVNQSNLSAPNSSDAQDGKWNLARELPLCPFFRAFCECQILCRRHCMIKLWSCLTATRSSTACICHSHPLVTSAISSHLPLTASKCLYSKEEMQRNPCSVQHVVSPSIPPHCTKLKPLTAVAGCHLEVDIILESSDGARFGSHIQNLEIYSDAFPALEIYDTSGSAPLEEVTLPESAAVVSRLLQYMHNQRQPDCSKLAFDVLSQMAEAAEKYIVFSTIQVCKIHMKCAFHTFACPLHSDTPQGRSSLPGSAVCCDTRLSRPQ